MTAARLATVLRHLRKPAVPAAADPPADAAFLERLAGGAPQALAALARPCHTPQPPRPPSSTPAFT
jgi:hypothetical protein